MRVVPILRDPGVRQSARDPVRVDAVLPRPPERRQAADVRGPGRDAEGPAGADSRADPPRDRDERPRASGGRVDGSPDARLATRPALIVVPSIPSREIVEWRGGWLGGPLAGGVR